MNKIPAIALRDEIIKNNRTLTNEKIKTVFNGGELEASFDGDTISLPALPVDLRFNRRQVHEFRGISDHEVLHALYTDWDIYKDILQYSHKCGDFFTPAFMNAVEDVRIERLGMERFTGMKRNLQAVANALSRYVKKALESDPKQVESLTTEKAMVGWLLDRGRQRNGMDIEIHEAFTPHYEKCDRLLDAEPIYEQDGMFDMLRELAKFLKDNGLSTLQNYFDGVEPPKQEQQKPEEEGQAGDGDDGDDDSEGNGQGQDDKSDQGDSPSSGEGEGEGEGEDEGDGEGESEDSQGQDENQDQSQGQGQQPSNETPDSESNEQGKEPEFVFPRDTATSYPDVNNVFKELFAERETKGAYWATPSDACDIEPFKAKNMDLENEVKGFQHQISGLAGRFAATLKSTAQQRMASSTIHGRLNQNRLVAAVQGEENIWMRKKSTERGLNTVLSFVLDHSASMRGSGRLAVANATLIELAKGARIAGIPFEVSGFTTGYRALPDNDAYPRDESTLISIIKRFDLPLQIERLYAKPTMNITPDDEALEQAYLRIRERPEKRKIIITLTDGGTNFNDHSYTIGGQTYSSMDGVEAHKKQVVTLCEQEGIEVFAIGLSTSPEYYTAFPPENVMIVDPNSLTRTVFNRLLDTLRRNQ